MAEDQKRTGARGYVGQGYEMTSYAINSVWGFDPREIRTADVAVRERRPNALLLQ